MECSICTETLNKSTRKAVQCSHCSFVACQKCVQRFLLENTVIPKCMSCSTEWNMEFMRTVMPRSFMDKEYKTHQKGAIQVEAEANLGLYQNEVRRQIEMEEILERERELQEEQRRIKEELDVLRHRRWRLGGPNHLNVEQPAGEETIDQLSREFFMACPGVECRGRLSTAYKCGLCTHFFCPDCHADKGLERNGEHECKKDDLDTVNLLKENTRPCPKCHMGIFKTQGCDQMWCTQCQTCFSWRTGNILNGTIHNPHFYEWQRQANGGQAPRVAGDVPCGGLPYQHQIRASFERSNPDTPSRTYINQIHRLAAHLEDMTMGRIGRAIRNRPVRSQKVGVEYLRGFINKEVWVDRLYRFSRQEEKDRRHYQVVETLVFNIQEFLRQFVAGNLQPVETINHCEKAIEFANTEIGRMNKQYNASLRKFRFDMDTTTL